MQKRKKKCSLPVHHTTQQEIYELRRKSTSWIYNPLLFRLKVQAMGSLPDKKANQNEEENESW